jgi:transcriptional regulator with XRE-family HTH domain
MAKNDLDALRALLRQLLTATRIPIRELERRLGIGHGNYYTLLDGSLEMRVHHLLAIARLLEIPPGELLAAGCPQANESAKYHVDDWLAMGRPRQAARETAPVSADLVEIIRTAVREEVAAQVGRAAGGRQAPKRDTQARRAR